MYTPGVFEVHSVQVFIKKNKGASKEVYGHVTIDDNEADIIHLFSANKQHAQALSTHGLLPISGPSRCIVSNSCVMNVALFEKNMDLEICKGYLSLEQTYPIDHGRPITILFESDYGFARFHVSLFDYAIPLLAEVVFVPSNGSKPGEYTVSGEISAQYSSYEYTDIIERYHKTRLFESPREEAMNVRTVSRDGCQIVRIPLTRPAVGVPYDNWLGIDIELWVSDSEDRTPQLISGFVLFFLPHNSDKATEYVEGKFGRIEVHMTRGSGLLKTSSFVEFKDYDYDEDEDEDGECEHQECLGDGIHSLGYKDEEIRSIVYSANQVC